MKQLIEEQAGPETHSDIPIPVRIRADNSRPAHLIGFFSTVLLVGLACVLVAVFVAPAEIIVKSNATELRNTTENSCTNPSGFENDTLVCNPFGLHNPNMGLFLTHMSVLNQFALFSLDIENETLQTKHQFNQNITIVLYSLNEVRQGKVAMFTKKALITNRTIQFQDANHESTFIFYRQQVHHMLGFNRHINQEHYLLVVNFDKPEQMVDISVRASLKAILFDPLFTIFVIVVRGFGCVITLATGAWYAYSYFKISRYQRLIEQKLVLVLSLLVFLFNDPLYSFSVLFPNVLSTVLSVLFFTQFIAYFFFFWLLGAERIIKEEGLTTTNLLNRPHKLMYFLYFAGFFTMISFYYSELAVSAYEGHVILTPSELFPGLSVVFVAWLSLNIALFLFMFARVSLQDRKLTRSELWMSFTLFYALIIIAMVIYMGFYSEENSRLILISYSATSVYCICMQYMFSPAPSEPARGRVPVDHMYEFVGNGVEIEQETQ